jgi:hypothetical protein
MDPVDLDQSQTGASPGLCWIGVYSQLGPGARVSKSFGWVWVVCRAADGFDDRPCLVHWRIENSVVVAPGGRCYRTAPGGGEGCGAAFQL